MYRGLITLLANAPVVAGGVSDDFTDGSRATIWDENAILFTKDALVTVVESGGVVTITPRTAQTGNKYNGYITATTYDLTGRYIAIEVPQVASGANAETIFMAKLDASNYVQFSYVDTDLLLRVRDGGANSNTHLTYNATTHRWWKIAFSGGNTILSTSPDGSTWTARKTSTLVNFIPATLLFGFEAGTFASETPGTAIFDNFTSDI